MKLKTILTLLAALGILTACNDDFFDQVPDDRIPGNQQAEQMYRVRGFAPNGERDTGGETVMVKEYRK